MFGGNVAEVSARSFGTASSAAVRPSRASANSNIALVKYWGKRHDAPAHLNLPAVGSLSVTLDGLSTTTEVHPADADAFLLNGAAVDAKHSSAVKVFRHLDLIWRTAHQSQQRPPCRVESTNHFPTAAGLASSASGFAALTVAAASAFGADASTDRLSRIAREGSGSAMRSLWGGFVRLHKGTATDGSDCRAEQIFPASHWDIRVIVVHCAVGSKTVGSREGMERSRITSPYFAQWVDTSEADLSGAAEAIAERNIDKLGEIVEHSSCKMHACMLASRPPLLYWNDTTVRVMHELWRLRREANLRGFATSDAGPHVKVVCEASSADALAEALRKVPGVHGTQILSIGPDPTCALLS